MKNLIELFYSQYHYCFQTQWFKRCLYFFLLIKCVYWYVYFDVVFGAFSIYEIRDIRIGSLRDFAFTLNAANGSTLPHVFIGVVVISCGLLLVLKRNFYMLELLLWFSVLNINNKLFASATAGDYLLNQLLFFNIFLASNFQKQNTFFSNFKMALHNFACLGIILQVCLMYVFSAVAKLGSNDWLMGTALADALQIEHFTLFNLSVESGFSKSFLKVLSYSVVAYQLFFPLLIWIPPIKKPLLIFGILSHLYIGLFMGLVWFGIIVLISYIYFWPFKKRLV